MNKDTKQAPVAVAMVNLGQGAIQAASGTGGFGNRQTANALVLQKVVYKDILIHNLHVSIQEFQKKSKMYQKKVTKKRQELISSPELQYMNIYRGPAKRLSVFQEIGAEADKQNFCDDVFYGDATAYEKYLDYEVKNMMEQERHMCQQQHFQQAVIQQQQSLMLQNSLDLLTTALQSQPGTYSSLKNLSSECY